ncbi:MAG TPA: prepilin peptidase [Thermoleophilaceae bacterium]|nr:prepilin peptidase [Thermoleophilaceae bacterium]
MDVLLIGLLGLAVGSFLNVVIHRLPRGESLVSPPSHCPACDAPVKPYDNVPVLSWLLLRGRCRNCGAPISARYPVVEALTAAAFVATALARGVEDDLALWLPFVAVLIAVAAIDLDHRIIPNKIVLPAAIWGLAATVAFRPDHLDDALIAGAIAFGALLLAALAYPAGMGMGDVKLAGVMGIYLGSAVAPAMLVAFLSGSLVGLAIIAREGRDARKKGVPFGPFLAFGGLVGVLFGPELVDLYVDNFL